MVRIQAGGAQRHGTSRPRTLCRSLLGRAHGRRSREGLRGGPWGYFFGAGLKTGATFPGVAALGSGVAGLSSVFAGVGGCTGTSGLAMLLPVRWLTASRTALMVSIFLNPASVLERFPSLSITTYVGYFLMLYALATGSASSSSPKE